MLRELSYVQYACLMCGVSFIALFLLAILSLIFDENM